MNETGEPMDGWQKFMLAAIIVCMLAIVAIVILNVFGLTAPHQD